MPPRSPRPPPPPLSPPPRAAPRSSSSSDRDRTTITIAHRLDTVIEGDGEIIVMEQGVLQEFAAPLVLLGDKESMFSELVNKSGAPAAAALRAVAAEYFAPKGATAART
jgi:hypothetical protein